MCGIFGFIAKNGKGPDLARLRWIAAETQRRGPHAFGLAWVGPDGRIHTYKRPGPAMANLGDLEACRGSVAILGHCRWATHGSPQDNRNNHPHPAGRGWFVHNGVVHNHDQLARQYNLARRTECDSEVLGLLMAHFGGSLGERAVRTATVAEGSLAVLGLWARPTRMIIIRNDNPLHFGETAAGFYFASMPDALPGEPEMIKDSYVGVLTAEDKALWHEQFKIEA